jgi:hypothetical protein
MKALLILGALAATFAIENAFQAKRKALPSQSAEPEIFDVKNYHALVG